MCPVLIFEILEDFHEHFNAAAESSQSRISVFWDVMLSRQVAALKERVKGSMSVKNALWVAYKATQLFIQEDRNRQLNCCESLKNLSASNCFRIWSVSYYCSCFARLSVYCTSLATLYASWIMLKNLPTKYNACTALFSESLLIPHATARFCILFSSIFVAYNFILGFFLLFCKETFYVIT